MLLLLEIILVAGVLVGVAVAVTGRDPVLGEVEPDAADIQLPMDRPVGREDVDNVRFSLALRGYRMSEVDDTLDRLAAELAKRDAEIARLRTRVAPAGGGEAAGEYDADDTPGAAHPREAPDAAHPREAPDAADTPGAAPSVDPAGWRADRAASPRDGGEEP